MVSTPSKQYSSLITTYSSSFQDSPPIPLEQRKGPIASLSLSMEKAHQIHGLISAIIISSSLLSFLCCIVAEFKKAGVSNLSLKLRCICVPFMCLVFPSKGRAKIFAQAKDVKLDGNLCYLPGTGAFGFGIGGLMCLVTAQIIGNVLVWRIIMQGGKSPTPFAIILLGVSWISFGIAIVLLSTATSMNRKQPYGRGWLGGECYVVKKGIYAVSAVLVIFTIGSTMSLVAITWREIIEKQRQEILSSKGVQNERRSVSTHC
ncbi:hypothetical protein Dimus_007731 [Dionaea muscipula]